MSDSEHLSVDGPPPAPASPVSALQVGDEVRLRASGERATLAFLGQTAFAPGMWAGIVLGQGTGKNDGSVQGVRYFVAPPKHGMFVRPALLEPFFNQPPAQPIPTTTTTATTTTATTNDLAVLQRRLVSLEAGRVSDRARIVELERQTVQHAQFAALKPKLQARMAELQAELQQIRPVLKERDELKHSLESLALDHEIAQEAQLERTHELHTAQEQLLDLQSQLDSLRSFSSFIPPTDLAPSVGGAPTAHVEHLENTNARLRQALLKLRAVSTEREAASAQALATAQHDLARLKPSVDRLAVAEAQVADLKVQLDLALGAEDMLEELTERNLQLAERASTLSDSVRDLEALVEVGEQVEAEWTQTEKSLLADLLEREKSLEDQQHINQGLKTEIAEHLKTITQFRHLVATLKQDVEMLRQSEQSATDKSVKLASQSRDMLSLTHKLQLDAQNRQSTYIQHELVKISATDAQLRATVSACYLPQAFQPEEAAALSAMQAYHRLAGKITLMSQVLETMNDISGPIEVGDEHVLFSCQIRVHLSSMRGILRQAFRSMQCCTMEQYDQFGSVIRLVADVESRIEAWLEQLASGDIAEESCLVEVAKISTAVSDAFKVHKQPFTLLAIGEGQRAKLEAVSVKIDLSQVNVMLVLRSLQMDPDTQGPLRVMPTEITAKDRQASDTIEQAPSQAFALDIGQDWLSHIRPLKPLVQYDDFFALMDTAEVTRDLTRLFDKLCEESKGLGSSSEGHWSQVEESIDCILKMSEQSRKVVTGILQRAPEKRGETIIVDEATKKAVEEALSSLSPFENLTSSLQQVLAASSQADSVITVSPTEPWKSRAEKLYSKLQESVDTQKELLQRADEVRRLQKGIEQQEVLAQEATLKLGFLERKLTLVQDEARDIPGLKAYISEKELRTVQLEKQLQEVQEALQDAQSEHQKLKDNALGSIDDFDSELQANAGNVEVYTLNLMEQVASLRRALAYTRMEYSHSQGIHYLDGLPRLPGYSVPPPDPSAKTPKEPAQVNDAVRVANAISLENERRILCNKALLVATSCRVVDVTRPQLDGGKLWRAQRSLPRTQLERQRAKLRAISSQIAQFDDRLQESNFQQKWIM